MYRIGYADIYIVRKKKAHNNQGLNFEKGIEFSV